jgi:hypothetical protein
MNEPTYTVWVTTGDVALGGTDSNVFLMLFGEAGQTEWIHLPPEDVFAFEQGSTDKFVIVAPDVGSLTQLCVAHDNTADSGWHVAKVRVQHHATQQIWDIVFNQWVGEEEAGRLVVCESC